MFSVSESGALSNVSVAKLVICSLIDTTVHPPEKAAALFRDDCAEKKKKNNQATAFWPQSAE